MHLLKIFDKVVKLVAGFVNIVYNSQRHQSNQAFGRSPRMEMRAINPAIPLEPNERSEEEVTREREASYQAALRAERRRGMQSLTLVGIVMMIDLCVFGAHWMLSKRARVAL